jgi:conjugal transfer/entry exclusion protein
MATVKSLETEIAVIKNDVNQIGQLFSKLETALDKITDVSNNIGQILAVHEQRLKDGEVHFDELRKDMDNAEDKFDNEVKDLHSRLTTNTREIEQKMSNEVDKVLEAIKDLKSHMVDKHDKLETRLAALERWRWILLGAFITGAMLSGNGVTFKSLFAM